MFLDLFILMANKKKKELDINIEKKRVDTKLELFVQRVIFNKFYIN